MSEARSGLRSKWLPEPCAAMFNKSGNADRYAPIYGAYVAHVRGERFLRDLNAEVRGVVIPTSARMTFLATRG